MNNEKVKNPFPLAMAVAAISPKNKELSRALQIDNGITWRSKPFLHEWMITQLFFGFKERNGFIDESYAKNSIEVLRWINRLDPSDLESKNKNIQRQALLLDDKDKLRTRIKLLEDSIQYHDYDNMEFQILFHQSLMDDVMTLRQSGIFYGDGITDSGELV